MNSEDKIYPFIVLLINVNIKNQIKILYLESTFPCVFRPAKNVARFGICNIVWSIFDDLYLGLIEESVFLIDSWWLVVFDDIFGPNSEPIIYNCFVSEC